MAQNHPTTQANEGHKGRRETSIQRNGRETEPLTILHNAMISREQFINALRNLGFTKSKAEDIWADTITASQTHKAGKGVGAKPGTFNAKLKAR